MANGYDPEADTSAAQLAELEEIAKGGTERTIGARPVVIMPDIEPPPDVMPEFRPSVTDVIVDTATLPSGEDISRDEFIAKTVSDYHSMGRYLKEGDAEEQAAKDWSTGWTIKVDGKDVFQGGGGAVDYEQIGDWQREYMLANPGATQTEALAYSQDMWRAAYGVTIPDMVSTGTIMPNVTMEAPEGGIIPVGATVSKRDVDGKPTTYEFDGVSYYVKGGSMYEEGYRTSKEYRTAQQMGTDIYGGPHGGANIDARIAAGRNFIIITKPDGSPMLRATMEAATAKDSNLLGYVNRGLYKYDLGVATYKDADSGIEYKIPLQLTPKQYAEYTAVKTEDARLGLLQTWGMISEEHREQTETVLLYSGERISKQFLDELKASDPQLASLLYREGLQAFRNELSQKYVTLPTDGSMMLRTEFDKLDKTYQDIAISGGSEALTQAIQLDQKEYDNYVNSSPEEKFAILQKADYVPEGSTYAGADENGNPMYHLEGEAPEEWNAKRVGEFAAEAIIPGLYVANNWDELSVGERALWIGVDILSILPVVGWIGKAGAVSARTAKAVGIAGRAVQAARSAGYAVKTIPKGMITFAADVAIRPAIKTGKVLFHPHYINPWRYPIATAKYVGASPAKAMKGLAQVTLEPIIHPLRTTKTLAGVATGSIQLGNYLPAGAIGVAGRLGRTVPLRTVTGEIITVGVPETTKVPGLRIAPESLSYTADMKAGKVPVRNVPTERPITSAEKAKWQATETAKYNAGIESGEIKPEKFYVGVETTGEIKYAERLPDFYEWKGKSPLPHSISTGSKKVPLTPEEYEIYKLIQSGKIPRQRYSADRSPSPEQPLDTDGFPMLDDMSLAQVRAGAIKGVVQQSGFRQAVATYGNKLVRTIYPDADKLLASEIRLQKAMAPARAESRKRITERVTRFIYEELNASRITPEQYTKMIASGAPKERFIITNEGLPDAEYLMKGTGGSEAELKRVIAAGYMSVPSEGKVITVPVATKAEAITELARIADHAVFTLMPSGAWKVTLNDYVPREGLKLDYPLYISDTTILGTMWAMSAGTISACGEISRQR